MPKTKQSLLDSLPLYYAESPEVDAIMEANASEIDRKRAEARDLLDQFFIRTATWGLDYWERIVSVEPDYTRSTAERRAVIQSKIRGSGVVTMELIKNVAEAYDGGMVEVAELPAEYRIIVTFIDTRGIPSNLSDTEQAIRNIIPAHLNVDFEFTYLSWAELDAENLKWSEFDSMAFTWAELETYKF